MHEKLFVELPGEPSEAEMQEVFPSRLHSWWAGLDDKSLFGYHFCFSHSGRWWRFPWVTLRIRREMFWTRDGCIPGAQLYIFAMLLQVTRERDWAVEEG